VGGELSFLTSTRGLSILLCVIICSFLCRRHHSSMCSCCSLSVVGCHITVGNMAPASHVRKEEGKRNHVAHLNTVDSDNTCHRHCHLPIGLVKQHCHIVVIDGVCSSGFRWLNNDCEVVVVGGGGDTMEVVAMMVVVGKQKVCLSMVYI